MSHPTPTAVTGWWQTNRHLVLFSAATFFFWTALYVYSPILSVYAKTSGATLAMVGLIVAAYSIPQLLLRVPIGLLSSGPSRQKRILFFGMLMTSLGALGLGLFAQPWFIFTSRAITGIGAATWVTFTVYFAAFYDKQQSTKAIGVINTVQSIALVLSSFAGGLIADGFGYSGTFFTAAALGLVAIAALAVSRAPEAPPLRKDNRHAFAFGSAWLPLGIVCFMGVLSQFVQWAGLFGFVPVYAAQIGASSADLGLLSTLCLAATAFASFFVVRVAGTLGHGFSIVIGAALVGITMALVPLIETVWLLQLDMLVNGLGRGVLSTILMAMAIQHVAPERRPAAMGLYQAAYAIGMVFGPLSSGYLAQSQGLPAVFYLSALMCLALAVTAFLPVVRKRLA
jgi:MFS family permease